MENRVFKQIHLQDDPTPGRLCIEVFENVLEVLLFQDENAWKSKVEKKKIQHFAKEHKIAVEHYNRKLIEYVKNGTDDIVYLFSDGEFTINRVLKGSLMVKYLTCTLEKVNYAEHVEQIMDKFSQENVHLSEQVLKFKKENDDIIKSKNQCETKLRELIDKKVTDENEQYGHFILILNEKKRKIQHLTELLEAFKKGRSIANPDTKVSKSRNKGLKKVVPLQKETISDSESSDDDSIHSLNEDISSPKMDLPDVPSTSTDAYDFLEDDLMQTQSLPKRAKVGATQSNDIVVACGSPKSPPKITEIDNSKQKKPSGIDLSTQQLLDML